MVNQDWVYIFSGGNKSGQKWYQADLQCLEVNEEQECRFLFREGPLLVQGYAMTLLTCHCVGHLPPKYLVPLRDRKLNLAAGLSITVSFDFTLNLRFTFTLCSCLWSHEDIYIQLLVHWQKLHSKSLYNKALAWREGTEPFTAARLQVFWKGGLVARQQESRGSNGQKWWRENVLGEKEGTAFSF